MQIVTDRPQAPTAIRTDLGAIFVSLELSRSTWLVTSLSPGGGEKIEHTVRSGDVAGLRTRFSQLKDKVQIRMGQVVPIIVIQEAGLDGFCALPTTRRAGSWLFAAAGFRLWRRLVRQRRIRSARASAPIRHKRQPAVGGKASEQSLRPQDTGEFRTNPLQTL